MSFIVASSKADFQQYIRQRVKELAEPGEQEALALFAEEYFGVTSLEDLGSRHERALIDGLLCAWRMMQQYGNAGVELPGRFRGGCLPGYGPRVSPTTAGADL